MALWNKYRQSGTMWVFDHPLTQSCSRLDSRSPSGRSLHEAFSTTLPPISIRRILKNFPGTDPGADAGTKGDRPFPDGNGGDFELLSSLFQLATSNIGTGQFP